MVMFHTYTHTDIHLNAAADNEIYKYIFMYVLLATKVRIGHNEKASTMLHSDVAAKDLHNDGAEFGLPMHFFNRQI